MKLLALTQDGFLLTVTKEELAQICGYKTIYTDGYKEPKIGSEINTAKFFNVVMSAKQAQSSIADNAKRLQGIVDTLAQVRLPEIADA